MKNIIMTPRVLAIFVFVISALTLICFGLYTFGAPQFSGLATQTSVNKTQNAVFIIQTNAISTEFANATALSDFQTQTAIPTITSTITPLPILQSCQAEIRAGTVLYSGPSKGSLSYREQESSIFILAEAKNIGWYKIDTVSNQFSWVQKQDVDIQDNCIPASVSLSFLLGLDSVQRVILEENFSTAYSWVGKNEELISPIPSPEDRKVQRLPISGTPEQIVSLRNQHFGYLDNFTIFTSFSWARSGSFGFRFWNDGLNYYDVFIDQNCDIQIIDSGDLLVKRTIITDKFCYYGYTNYLEVSLSKDAILNIKVNEAEPIVFQLDKVYQGEKISFVVTNEATVNIEYIIVTTNP